MPYVKDLGFTHIELLPVMEHPFSGSWGYQVIGFFAPTSRFGTPEDFKYFVDACHQAGIGVILDWVPGHFPKDAHGLARFDGTALYEHADPRQGEHQDWGTLIFNYGRNEVRNFLLSNALFWLEEYHIDGLRVDAVASMLYLDYSRKRRRVDSQPVRRPREPRRDRFPAASLNMLTHGEHPGHHHRGGGVDGVARRQPAGASRRPRFHLQVEHGLDARHARVHARRIRSTAAGTHNLITFSMLYAYTENFILPFSHDEVVHGKGSMLDKMPGDVWQKHATLRALYGFMYGHPGKKLLFMGGEFGQWREWNHDRSLDWHLLDEPRARRHAAASSRRSTGTTAAEPALHECDFSPAGFRWIDCNDNENSVVVVRARVAAIRSDFVRAWSSTSRRCRAHDYRIGVPAAGFYAELLNSDSALFGGSNVGNGGGVDSRADCRARLRAVDPPDACRRSAA